MWMPSISAGVRERHGDVVAVADERQRAALDGVRMLVSVSMSARAWHGCCSSRQRIHHVQPRRRGRESASLACANVRMTAPVTQRSRLRATSATVSRPPSAASGGQLDRRRRPVREWRSRRSCGCGARASRTSSRRAGRPGRPQSRAAVRAVALSSAASASTRSSSSWRESSTERKSLVATGTCVRSAAGSRKRVHSFSSVASCPVLRVDAHVLRADRSHVHMVAACDAAGAKVDAIVDLVVFRSRPPAGARSS